MNDSQQGLELFECMRKIWEAAVPTSLSREDPSFLVRFLELCDSENGISQSELARILTVDPPRVSRLSTRLKDAHWITDKIPQGDGRLRLTKLTDTGKQIFERLLADLKTAKDSFEIAAQKARQAAEEWESESAQMDALFSRG